MPSVLSKILMPEWNLPYNCYELGHTWTPYCSEAALDIGLIVFVQSLKLYTPLYLGNQAVFQRKFDRKTFLESVRSILQSSAFLGINAFLVLFLFCLHRRLAGKFYYSLCAYLPSFVASLLAIQAERPSRRRALAFYVANIASETLYRTLVARGYVTPVPNGRFLLFTSAVTSLIYMSETGLLREPLLRFAIKLFLGPSKLQQRPIERPIPLLSTVENDELASKRSRFNLNLDNFLHQFGELYQRLRDSSELLSRSHPSCPHSPSIGCAEDILLNGLMKPFLIGYSSQLAMRALPRMLSLRFRDVKLLDRKYARFGLFLASFSTIYRSVRCGLRHWRGKDSSTHSLIAALLASPSQFLAPSTSLTLYLVWKSVEAIFSAANAKGLFPWEPKVVNLIYAMATAELFYAAVLDPAHIKPSYQRFLDRVTDRKLTQINRNVLEVFGTNASVGYESFMPVYDLAHTTRRFRESVLVWLL